MTTKRLLTIVGLLAAAVIATSILIGYTR